MVRERLIATVLIEKQQEEQEEFLLGQARRLMDVDYDWEIPEAYSHWNDTVRHKGLIVDQYSGDGSRGGSQFATILNPRGEIFVLEADQGSRGRYTPEEIMNASARGLLQKVEKAVDRKVELAEKRKAAAPAG